MKEQFSFLPGWKKEKPQVELSEVTKKKKYDPFAALAKAVLVFMLSFGAVGGFLSAYGMTYNRVLGGLIIFGVALFMSLVYETERKWLTNLCVIGVFIVYAYVAVSRFWILNSGAYAVINEMYEQAQNYLGVVGSGLYSLQIDDPYLTVTAISIFVGVVLDILLVLRLQYKASLLRTVLLTFTAYLVPLYFECTPSLFYLFLLFSGYLTIGILQRGGVKKHISAQIKQALPIAAAISAVLVFFFGVLLPKGRYRTMVPKNPDKAATETAAMNYAQYGVMALLMNNMAGGGVNAGKLSNNVTVMPDNEPDLLVRFTPYGMDPVYLKAFTGLAYDGSSWSDASAVMGFSEGKLIPETDGRQALYAEDPALQSRGIMEIVTLDKDLGAYEFQPYYTDVKSVERISALGADEKEMRYVYYPVVSGENVPGIDEEKISERYLVVPSNCAKAVEKACREAALVGTPEQIAAQIFAYFSTNYSYTLRPGYYFGNMDYISYFLSKNKKGYCAHFASAGTMLFRYMGIPARYVEGYVFTYSDVLNDGMLQEDIPYDDFYDGYAPLGETAVIELKVPDANAHAWIEIYLQGKGWTVVDVTPAASLDEEETGSFWENFLNGNTQEYANGGNLQETADYLENALEGGAGLLGVILLVVSAFFLGRWGYGIYQESKLPGRQRVQLEYGRLTKRLKERYEEFSVLTTPAEELNWIKKHFEMDLPEGLQEELYQIFFAPEKERDYQLLRQTLVRMRKKCR